FFTPVDGSFEEYSSEINFDPSDLENSNIDVTIPVSSINTKNERRDNHLKSEDFFNASEWPNIQFESNEIEQTGDNQFVAHGELTIRDVTREFELPFELLGVMDHPMQEGKKVAGITASAQLNRTDYGVGVGDWAATAVVGDEVNIQLNLELTAPRDDMTSN
ncbi:MAG: polyisoprenoid-binding protein, partial [Bacteroidetes bacterium]|nr:polyisoprenoid-binding protein [Bacteroidota bacterium]